MDTGRLGYSRNVKLLGFWGGSRKPRHRRKEVPRLTMLVNMFLRYLYLYLTGSKRFEVWRRDRAPVGKLPTEARPPTVSGGHRPVGRPESRGRGGGGRGGGG